MDNTQQILKNLTILYAEDDPITRENIARTLSLFVQKVITVSNGIEAIEMFQKKAIHIVILDYVMPFMDGNETAKKIQAHDPSVPIIMLSSYTDKEKLLKMIKTGVTDYLEKPINFEELCEGLERAVQKLIGSGKLLTRLAEGIEYNHIDKTLQTPTSSERLTKHEYKFLEMMLQRPSSLITKEEVEHKIFMGEVESNALRNLVYRLRKKIAANVIITIKDLGYMFRPS